MKFKTTKNAVMNGYARVYRCGYCDLQDLLPRGGAVAYTSGVYGWNTDIYDLGALADSVYDVAICTGYRPFGREIPGNLVQEYNEKAKALSGGNYHETRRALRALRAEFLRAILDADKDNK